MVSDIDRRRKTLVSAGGLVALISLAYSIWVCWPAPQLTTDEQVFNTVDALFTALTARDATRLEECEQRLTEYHAEGRISDAVAARLDAIVKQARHGGWEPAARTLYDFIMGQRGDS